MKIKKLKNNKYKIVLNNGETITTYDDIIIEKGLLYKKDLSDIDILEITKKNAFYDIYYLVIRYLSKRRRSSKEVWDYLDSICDDVKVKKKIIDKIKSLRLLNDNDYAQAYANDRFYLANIGPNLIKSELLEKGISTEIIDNVCSNFSKDEILNKLDNIVKKKINQNKSSSWKLFKIKIVNDLLKKGYDKSDINTVLENVESFNDEANLKKEYDKLLLKFTKKYDDQYQLQKKLKEKLYQKGYSLDDINKIINIE